MTGFFFLFFFLLKFTNERDDCNKQNKQHTDREAFFPVDFQPKHYFIIPWLKL